MTTRPTRAARPRRHTLRLALCALALAACGGGSDAGPAGPPGTPGGGGPTLTTSVAISGFAFAPPAIQVSPGATVTFTNQDATNHNVTFTSGAVPSVGNFSTGSRTVVMPTTGGSYAYHCGLHPTMTGSVTVQ